ncbi:MAG: 30S ribosomal protein S6e [Nanoarchaeota archaeon]|nr:30S ribosomal protein S6e [Nanoarchaeota archaeon]
MAEFKLVISDPKTGKSVQREVKEDSAKRLIGLKIGDTVKGELIDLPGYEFKITGGSDYAGFPMRWDVQGPARKKITAVKGVGVHNKRHLPNPKKKGMRTMPGMRLKKTVAGNTVHAKTAQINLKILKQGRESIFPEAAPAEAKAEQPQAAEAPKEEKPKKDNPKKAKGGKKVAEEKEVKEPETVPEKTEEVPEKVEEVPISGEEKVEEAPAEEAPKAQKKEKAPETEKKEEEDKTLEEVDKLDEEVKKDEEEIEKESKEIEKIEKELEEVDKEIGEEEKKEE